jgi:hypothetical protein
MCTTDFGPTFCSQATIANFCPLMCGQPICRCGFDSCLNGGIFMASTCTCSCPTQFNGARCENMITTTTRPTTTVSQCSQLLPCLNGAKQSPVTCKCECKKSINRVFSFKNINFIIFKHFE